MNKPPTGRAESGPLYFVYRPTTPASWNTVATEDLDLGVRLALGLRLFHRVVSYLTVMTAIAVAVMQILPSAESPRSAWGPPSA